METSVKRINGVRQWVICGNNGNEFRCLAGESLIQAFRLWKKSFGNGLNKKGLAEAGP